MVRKRKKDNLKSKTQIKAVDAWLILLFSLPRSQASGRVDVWRRLKKSGAAPLASGGHVLPNSNENRERFEWLAEAVREYGGEASVLSVSAIHDLPPEQLRELFLEARDTDYSHIIEEATSLKSDAHAKESGLVRLRRRLQEVVEIDYFEGAMKQRAEAALEQLAGNLGRRSTKPRRIAADAKQFTNRIWLTRPRPGIDRAASAWLIVNFIDPKARFKFAKDQRSVRNAIPFDMYQSGGFGHRGDCCTFETLLQEFKLRDRPLRVLAEMVHDADLKDEKFGRFEALTIEQVLKGWASKSIGDEELLVKGIELIDGLYRSLQR
jgi:hypothetical protein